MYNFKIRHCDWYKRRTRSTQPKVVTRFIVENFVAQNNTYCNVTIWYDDEDELKELSGRVTRNDMTGKFSINGINSTGDFVLLDVIETE